MSKEKIKNYSISVLFFALTFLLPWIIVLSPFAGPYILIYYIPPSLGAVFFIKALMANK